MRKKLKKTVMLIDSEIFITFQKIKSQWSYIKMLSKNYLIWLPKPIDVVSVNIISLVSLSLLHVFFPILPREEKMWQWKKERKENSTAPRDLTVACSTTFLPNNSICYISTADYLWLISCKFLYLKVQCRLVWYCHWRHKVTSACLCFIVCASMDGCKS